MPRHGELIPPLFVDKGLGFPYTLRPMEQVADSAFFASIEAETHFFIVRHGQSEGNAGRIFQGKLDLPLNDSGRAQALAAGRWLADAGVDAIFASPLARAAESARIAASACPRVEARLDPIFSEIDTGIFTGLSFEESRERHPEVFAAFEGASWEAVPGAEKAEALFARAIEAWSLLLGQAHAGSRAIACFSHGGFIQWLIRATFGCRGWMPLLSTANCGIFELIVEPTPGGSAYLQWRHMNLQAPTA
jgi:broad specificity phosphatase PhoE